jgi:hypothetical protein
MRETTETLQKMSMKVMEAVNGDRKERDAKLMEATSLLAEYQNQEDDPMYVRLADKMIILIDMIIDNAPEEELAKHWTYCVLYLQTKGMFDGWEMEGNDEANR